MFFNRFRLGSSLMLTSSAPGIHGTLTSYLPSFRVVDAFLKFSIDIKLVTFAPILDP
jgi:hypothetical protein